jgi:Tfp pilus assembly protein PilF
MKRFIPILISLVIIAVFASSCKDKKSESQRYVREGNLYLTRSLPVDAREYFEKALKYDQQNVEALYGMALSYANLRQYKQAVPWFDQAIEIKPDYMDAIYGRGQAYYYMGELRLACEDWYAAYDLGKPNITDQLRMCP